MTLDEFYEKHCIECGSQRCIGVYDKEWREGCKLYKNEFEDNSNFVDKRIKKSNKYVK